MLNREYEGQICSIARALDIVGERWTLLIIRDAFLGIRRFDELQESLGVARNVLTDRLNWLVGEGVLDIRGPGCGVQEAKTITWYDPAPLPLRRPSCPGASCSKRHNWPRSPARRACGSAGVSLRSMVRRARPPSCLVSARPGSLRK